MFSWEFYLENWAKFWKITLHSVTRQEIFTWKIERNAAKLYRYMMTFAFTFLHSVFVQVAIVK